MKRKILLNSDTFIGTDVFGRKTAISFHPARKPGWYIRTPIGTIPIDHHIAFSIGPYVQLRYLSHRLLNVYEHIGALRWAGYDQMELEPHGIWSPYEGGAGAYLRFFENNLHFQETGENIPRIMPASPSKIVRGKNEDSFMEIQSPQDLVLSMDMFAQWPGLPAYKKWFVFEHLSADEQIKLWNARPQGYPHYQKGIAKIVTKILKWPNQHHISWKGDASDHAVSEEWFWHAVQDTLGTLSLADAISLPTLLCLRSKGGHELDLRAVKRSFK